MTHTLKRPRIQVGVTVRVGCQGCDVKFPWTAPPSWWEQVPAYHSRTCRERARRARKALQEYVPCPRPDKALYTTQIAAHEHAVFLSKRQGELLTEYRCVCGGLHVGRVPYWPKYVGTPRDTPGRGAEGESPGRLAQ